MGQINVRKRGNVYEYFFETAKVLMSIEKRKMYNFDKTLMYNYD